ncbi:TPA: hypothetical protein N0F65_004612 [Lagenidium giganteum]|uniref:Protein kinase domain-containing protein n=1 Tax=Lagenidium giganteum TaxID=4803 RepID=A0AAV2ZG05_9STRA|nr:TPA: hypothetical protein N0F65_004612 [Lagenidium giganteum]
MAEVPSFAKEREDHLRAVMDRNSSSSSTSADVDQRGHVGSHLRFHTWEVTFGYLVMMLFSALLLKYTSFVHHQLATGDSSFKPQAILPSYRALLWLLAATSALFVCIHVTLVALDAPTRLNPFVYLGLLYSGRHLVLMITPAFMYQKSLSGAALARSTAKAFVLVGSGLPFFALDPYGSKVPMAVVCANLGVILCFFVYLHVRPVPRAPPAVIRRYAVFVLVHLALSLAQVSCLYWYVLDEGAPFGSASCVWTAATPTLVWQLLKSDTEYWRGKGARSVILQQLFARKTNITERVSAEGLHVLIEMHRKHVLDFATLDLKRKIADGTKSTVIRGILRCKYAVSVKVYTPEELSDQVIAEFSQEAALCGNLVHPNITRFYGLSICPPTICLVFELCRGTLKDVSKQTEGDYGSLILWKTAQMLDAARAIAYLHSFSPPFIHRNLKLSCFLVDAEGMVKLGGFGDSRVLNQFADVVQPAVGNNDKRSTAAALSELRSCDYANSELLQHMPVHPPYSERVDVFALGIVFWEFLHPAREFPFSRGSQTDFPNLSLLGFDETIPDRLRQLVQSMWETESAARPTAARVVRRLESILEYLIHQSLHVVAATVDTAPIDCNASTIELFSGEDAVHNLVLAKEVCFPWQGVRLGNAMMECGFLHEERHLDRFRRMRDRMYFFTPPAYPLPSSRRDSAASLIDDDVIIPLDSNASDTSGRDSKMALPYPRRRKCDCKLHAKRIRKAKPSWKIALLPGLDSPQPLSSSYEDLLTSVLLSDTDIVEEA